MDSRFTVTFQGDHVRIETDAEKSLDYATALWTEVVRVCGEFDSYNVLAVSNAPGPMPILDGYSHAALFRELKIDGKFRIAWAELSDDAREATLFVETVLLNRGLPGKAFATEKEAKKWLLPDSTDSKT
jgi:hypothetical protein